jgi:hypothetical protein
MKHEIVITNEVWDEDRFIFDSERFKEWRAWLVMDFIREQAKEYQDLQIEFSNRDTNEITIWQNRIHIRSNNNREYKIEVVKKIREHLLSIWYIYSLRWKFGPNIISLKNKRIKITYDSEGNFINMIDLYEVRDNERQLQLSSN